MNNNWINNIDHCFMKWMISCLQANDADSGKFGALNYSIHGSSYIDQ